MIKLFSKKKNAEIVSNQKSLTVNDLSLCLYEEYEKVQKLKQTNEELQQRIADYKPLETENRTQLVVINELQNELKEKEENTKLAISKTEYLRNKIEEHKATIGELTAEKRNLEKKIESLENGLSAKSYNKALDDMIGKINQNKNIGKNQAIEIVKSMEKVEAVHD